MEYLFNLSVKETIRTQERLPVARSQGGNPPDAMVPKTVLVKSLNPVRNLRGEGVVVLNNESNPIIKLQKHIDERNSQVSDNSRRLRQRRTFKARASG